MAMKCSRCGGEVSQDEVFCGQCGAPNTFVAQATEMASAPPPRSGLLGAPQTPFLPAQPNPYSSPPSQPLMPPAAGQSQQGEFYKDATEAITRLPTPPSIPGGYPPPPTGQLYGVQPPPPHYSQPLPARPSYPGRIVPTPVPPPVAGKQKNNNAAILIISACLVIVLIAIISIAASSLLRGRQTYTRPTDTPTSVATSTTPTAAPTPTATVMPTPSPTAQPTPSPTVMPTPSPAPDNGFSWCTQACTDNGFLTEYPDGWQLATVTNAAAGVQFVSPTAQDIYAAFKANGPTSSSASDLVNADLNYFASKTNAMTPTPTAAGPTTTISGETWASGMISYQMDGQPKERVQVYATVYQGKAYVIELEAPDAQFDTINSQYFVNMIGKYQFQQTSP